MQKIGSIKFFYIFKSAINPNKFLVMANKVYRRIFDKSAPINKKNYIDWLESHSISFEEWSTALSPNLTKESLAFANSLYSRARKELSSNPYDMGGGGLVHILYFITRLYKPKTIVETGIASGYSSESILQAIKANSNNAKLFSSDFPYFRFPNSEKYIGQLVSDEFKDNWSVFLKGDDKNLKNIVSEISQIDFFHYDSDKSYIGRDKAFKNVKNYLSDGAIVMFDDINDNTHFYDLVVNNNFHDFVVISHKGSCVAGIVFLKKFKD
jgi:predicted O-methyltransferase YrrM